MRGRRLFAGLLVLLGGFLAAVAWAQDGTQRRILVPSFQGADELGTRAANVLALQISRTFRASDGKRSGEPFGRGVLLWDPEPMGEMSYAGAMRRAMDIGTLAHLILWGRAYTLGDDVVVQAYLTATPVLFRLTEPRHELWSVEYRPDDADRKITLISDLPSSHFTFAPVVLSDDAIRHYRSIPALTIFADRDFTEPVGRIGKEYRALRYESDAVYLRSGEAEGWVPLPNLSDRESEVSVFASALFRLLRGDWEGASVLLKRTLEMPQLPRSIRIDALLLQGLAAEQRGHSGLEWIQAALELNPYRVEACRYAVQAEVAALARKPPNARSSEALGSRLAQCRILFDPQDEWLKNVDSILTSLRR